MTDIHHNETHPCKRCGNLVTSETKWIPRQIYDPNLRRVFRMGAEFVLYFHSEPHGDHVESGKNCSDLWLEQACVGMKKTNGELIEESQR